MSMPLNQLYLTKIDILYQQPDVLCQYKQVGTTKINFWALHG